MIKSPISAEEVLARLQAIGETYKNDYEVRHGQADSYLCQVLIDLGYIEAVQLYTSWVKWYA